MSKKFFFLLLLGSLLGLAIGPGGSTIEAAQPSRFVDLDGDGFNDNEPDGDFNGIPDEFEAHGFLSSPMLGELQVSLMFSGSQTVTTPTVRVSSADLFAKREFVTRSICVTRSDFDSGFDSGLGLGSGLGGGGGCAGGICF